MIDLFLNWLYIAPTILHNAEIIDMLLGILVMFWPDLAKFFVGVLFYWPTITG